MRQCWTGGQSSSPTSSASENECPSFFVAYFFKTRETEENRTNEKPSPPSSNLLVKNGSLSRSSLYSLMVFKKNEVMGVALMSTTFWEDGGGADKRKLKQNKAKKDNPTDSNSFLGSAIALFRVVQVVFDDLPTLLFVQVGFKNIAGGECERVTELRTTNNNNTRNTNTSHFIE